MLMVAVVPSAGVLSKSSVPSSVSTVFFEYSSVQVSIAIALRCKGSPTVCEGEVVHADHLIAHNKLNAAIFGLYI